MEITISISTLFSKKYIAELEQKYGIENLGDLDVELDLDTEDGVIGFYDYAPSSEWSSHATQDIYGEVPYGVSVTISDDEVEAKPDLVSDITKTIEEMVKEKNETLIEYING